MWNDMFGIGLPVLEKILRSVLVYLALVVLLRIFGKRELAQLNPFDLVVLLTLSNTVQNAIIGNDNSVSGGMLGALTLLAINALVVRLLFRHRRLEEIVEGKPCRLIHRGKIVQRNLDGELLTHAELMTVLNRQGFSSIDEVEECVLEPGGTFSVKAKDPSRSEIKYAELAKRLESIDARLAQLAAGKS
jgi:uncharacterized membrane protein YcaP (DUF421 family)